LIAFQKHAATPDNRCKKVGTPLAIPNITEIANGNTKDGQARCIHPTKPGNDEQCGGFAVRRRAHRRRRFGAE